MNVCTSGRAIRGLTEKHEPCGHVLRIVGYTTRKQITVEACPRCDALPPPKPS